MDWRRKLIATISALALLVTIAVAGAVWATPKSLATTRADVSITIAVVGDSSFSGQVNSSNSTCKANRPVRLFQQVGASQNRTTDPVAATTTSSSSGAWAVAKAGLYGKFYAHTRISPTCNRAESATVTSSKATDVQPSFPIRAAFYYPWFPETWGNLSNPFTNYHPKLGFYNSSDAAVIHTHIQQMQYAGIDAGIASWWGQGTPTDGRVDNLLRGADGTTFRWTLYYEQEGSSNPSASAISSDLTYIKNHYSQDPNFLRVNGRPVIFVYGDGSDGCGMVDRWNQANTMNFYVVLKVFSGYKTCANQPASWHQYAPAVPTDAQLPYSYAVSPGFYKKGESAPRLARDPNRFASNVASMNASGAQWQLITTWNEWGEGSAVEPATEWNNTYLDILHGGPPPTSPPPTSPPPTSPPPTSPPPTSPPPTSPPPTGKHFVFIWMENKETTSITGSSAPYMFNTFAANGRRFTNFFGVSHPSLPNYLGFASGSTDGKAGTDSIRAGEIGANNVWNQLTGAGVTWKVYEESMPSTCYSGTSSGSYQLKHNPAIPFSNIFNSAQCQNVVPLTQLNFSAPSLPQVSFITPNMCNDMHDCSVATGDNWLKARVPQLLAAGATVIITFDEGSSGTGGGGHIFTALDGPGIGPSTNSTTYNHYSALAGLESQFGLPKLGAAGSASVLPLT